MRRLTPVALAVAALAFAPAASAHLVAKPKRDTLAAVAENQRENLAHARYVTRHGKGPHVRWHRLASRWLARELRETEARIAAARERNASPQSAICQVFGSYCSQALAVARCESGFSIYATNGQYLGLFQMGSYARSRYGHSYTAHGQARSAYAYFVDSGRDWSPWQCRPWGLGW